MKQLDVGLGDRSYPITIGAGCIETLEHDLVEKYPASRYCLVSDSNVAGLYGEMLVERLKKSGLACELLTFPQGEENKNLQTISDLARGAARLGLDRKSMFIALGGGVTGDITGFLASSYMRGVPFIQIPTSLLSQVDSSVGGKTGVDIPEGKNLVGAFYQPQAVYIDTNVLKTLPQHEYLSGLAEVIKYGFIWDRAFLDFLLSEQQNIMALEEEQLVEMIYTCCKIKAEVVSADEKESDTRRILNFGHTIGHAVEAASAFSISHGFAVAIGMVAVARIGRIKKTISIPESELIYDAIKQYGLPTEVPENLDRQKIKSYLLTDKKNIGGKIFYILPKTIGEVVITDTVTEEDVDSVLNCMK